MQSVGPYRFTEALGVCQVGTTWWAIDGQDRLVTVAVLEGAAAADQPWRQAFANAAHALAQPPHGQRYVNADFSASEPWAAYPSEEGIGAQRLFQALGMELHHAEARSDVLIPATGSVATPPQPVSGAPVSGAPVSGSPHLPWAMHAATVGQQPRPEVQQPGPEAVPTSPAPPPTQPGPADPFTEPVRRIQPSAPGAGARPRGIAPWLAVAALLLGMLAAVGGVAVVAPGADDPRAPEAAEAFPAEPVSAPGIRPWTQFSPFSPQERALAVVGPSLVFIDAVYTGIVRNRATNAPLRSAPLSFSRRCTGFVVSSDGHALTSSSCVHPDEETMRRIALDTAARILVREGKLAAGGESDYVTANLGRSVFTGIDPGTTPGSQIRVQLNEVKADALGESAIPAQVIKAQAVDDGDLALVKLAQDNLPAVEFEPTAAATESGSLLVAGFVASGNDLRSAVYRPQAKLLTVTGTSRRGALAMWRLGEDLGGVSHGGVAIDPAGRVVGMIDQDRARPDRANRVVLPASAFRELLDTNGIHPALAEPDRRYRSGLDAYFTGQFDTATKDLAAVVQQSPGNHLAAAYRDIAVDRQQWEAASPGAPAWARWLLAGAGSALLVVLALLVATLLRRRT